MPLAMSRELAILDQLQDLSDADLNELALAVGSELARRSAAEHSRPEPAVEPAVWINVCVSHACPQRPRVLLAHRVIVCFRRLSKMLPNAI